MKGTFKVGDWSISNNHDKEENQDAQDFGIAVAFLIEAIIVGFLVWALLS